MTTNIDSGFAAALQLIGTSQSGRTCSVRGFAQTGGVGLQLSQQSALFESLRQPQQADWIRSSRRDVHPRHPRRTAARRS